MLDRAETDTGMQVGLWIIHILLEYSFVYLIYRWVMIMKGTADKNIKSPFLCVLGFSLMILIPPGCLVGLYRLLPGYLIYWWQIAAYTSFSIFAVGLLWLVYLRLNPPETWKPKVSAAGTTIRNKVQAQPLQEKGIKAFNNEKDLENQELSRHSQQKPIVSRN